MHVSKLFIFHENVAFQTQEKLYTVSLMSSSSADFTKYVGAFDSSVNTLKIANTIQAPTVPEFPLATIGIVFAVTVGVFALVMRRGLISQGTKSI